MQENSGEIKDFRKKYRASLIVGWVFIAVAVLLAAAIFLFFKPSGGFPLFQTAVMLSLSLFLIIFGVFIILMARILRRSADRLEEAVQEQKEAERKLAMMEDLDETMEENL